MPYNDMTALLSMLYPSKEAPPQALQALFGFGPRESFDVLRSIRMLPTEEAGAKENIESTRLKNVLTNIGIPQRQAEVEAFLRAPTPLKFFGKEHVTPEGVALYQKPEDAVRRFEAGTGLTEANMKNILANANLTEAETEKIIAAIRENQQFGGPQGAEAVFKILGGAGPRALSALMGPGGQVDIEAARNLPKSPVEQLTETAIREALRPGGDIKRARELMGLGIPQVLKEEEKLPKLITPPKYKDSGLVHPDTGKPIPGDPKGAAITVAGLRADKQIREEWNDPRSVIGQYRKKNPRLTKEQVRETLIKGELKSIVEYQQYLDSLQQTPTTQKEGK